MKIQESSHDPIESQGLSGTGSFSLKASSHAFRLLSSGLYTNKIQAVIRELSCNAADAHVMNGNQALPFDIKLPNGLDGQFYVRDYGPGMSEKDVMSLYTTYFESTKQQSNDFTGGFGVGSKSPFAYTDMFTVVSINNGLRSTYTAYVDDSGEPKISKLGDGEPTHEPSGLSVSFPVKPEDQRTFQAEANGVLMWFKSPVNVLGVGESNKPMPFDKERVLFRTPNVVIFGKKSSDGLSLQSPPDGVNHYGARPPHSSSGTLGTVVMGNVHYPLPLDASIKDLPQAKWFAQHNAVFPVPIGSVSVAASREALAFDKFTKESVKGIVTTAFNDVAKELWKYIEKKTLSSKGKNDLSSHKAARQAMQTFHLADPDISTLFMDAIGATPEQRQLFEPRFLADPLHPPKTFSLVKLDYSGYGSHGKDCKIGGPLEWNRKAIGATKEGVDVAGDYHFVENGARMHGTRVDTAITNVVNAMKDKGGYYGPMSVYMLVPNDKADPVQYEKEKTAWMDYLGVELAPFSKMGEAFKNEGVAAIDPYGYNNQSVELLPTTPPFFWMSTSEFKKLGGKLDNNSYYNSHNAISPRNIHDMQKNLGMKTPIEKMYVVDDSDIDKVKKICPNAYSFIEDFCIKTLLAPKMQKKIGNIKPMMSQSSSTFSTIRVRVKREPEWAKTLEDSKLGGWLERMHGVKGSMSFDFTTMKVLTELKKTLGDEKFPSVIPEYYNGVEVEKTISAGYPFLTTHVALRATLGVQQLQHLKSYLQWCEQNGAKPPGQAAIVDTDGPQP